MVPFSVTSQDVQVLCLEVKSMQARRAIEVVPPAQSESGFYSRYFLVPKKDSYSDLSCHIKETQNYIY